MGSVALIYFVGMFVAVFIMRARAGVGIWLRPKIFGPDGFGPVWTATVVACGMAWHGEISISPDGRYAIVGAPSPQLVDLRTGHAGGFGAGHRAATWFPKAGPSVVLAVVGEHDRPPWRLVLLDLATFATDPVAELPRRVDGIQVARDGTIAARMNPADESGWFDELAVSTDDGRSFEPVLPLRGRTGWRRRGTRPRWVEPTGPAVEVILDAGFEAFLRAGCHRRAGRPGRAGRCGHARGPTRRRAHRRGRSGRPAPRFPCAVRLSGVGVSPRRADGGRRPCRRPRPQGVSRAALCQVDRRGVIASRLEPRRSRSTSRS